MVFGTELVILVEIGMPNFRTSNFDKENNEIELRLNLDLLDEKKEMAELRKAAYKCRVAKYYNQRVKHWSFFLGDLVLRKVTISTKEPNVGKLGPTWEGPYKVIKGVLIAIVDVAIVKHPFIMIRRLDCHCAIINLVLLRQQLLIKYGAFKINESSIATKNSDEDLNSSTADSLALSKASLSSTIRTPDLSNLSTSESRSLSHFGELVVGLLLTSSGLSQLLLPDRQKTSGGEKLHFP
ncbi:hypothetical protein Acr_10g0003230 [Actinidia rufa]|uniref:Uncharacterized protein n=1 Tax=Actinidia rufa TaxID=165716 RepID=A0A7J0F8A4_9ERIC|nr:hypothetical protein Acr_10g0003230 [Actinidia rufa]